MKTKTTSNPVPLLRGLFTSLLAIAAFFGAPAALLAQTLYVSTDGGPIDKVDSTGAVSLFATLPSAGDVTGLAFDSSGNLYVGSSTANEIDKITSSGVVSTFATGIQTPYFIAIQTTYSAQVQQPINPDGSSVFNVRRGVVPVKFTLTRDGTPTCALPQQLSL